MARTQKRSVQPLRASTASKDIFKPSRHRAFDLSSHRPTGTSNAVNHLVGIRHRRDGTIRRAENGRPFGRNKLRIGRTALGRFHRFGAPPTGPLPAAFSKFQEASSLSTNGAAEPSVAQLCLPRSSQGASRQSGSPSRGCASPVAANFFQKAKYLRAPDQGASATWLFFLTTLLRAALMCGLPKHLGRVAQLVEQGIENPRVGGSIPSPATMYFNDLGHLHRMVFFVVSGLCPDRGSTPSSNI